MEVKTNIVVFYLHFTLSEVFSGSGDPRNSFEIASHDELPPSIKQTKQKKVLWCMWGTFKDWAHQFNLCVELFESAKIECFLIISTCRIYRSLDTLLVFHRAHRSLSWTYSVSFFVECLLLWAGIKNLRCVCILENQRETCGHVKASRCNRCSTCKLMKTQGWLWQSGRPNYKPVKTAFKFGKSKNRVN